MSSDSLFDLLTPDLITVILIRLSVKTLLRCKLVSKSWLSLISSPDFINYHLKRTVATPGADETLIVYTEGDYSLSMLHLDSPHIRAPLGHPYSRGDYSSEPHFELVGSCNGLLCVSVLRQLSVNNNPNIYLWNPVTKQSKLIPPHNIRQGIIWVATGFGFDPIRNDYKVVRIVSWTDKPRASEVYSANTNVWRRVRPFYLQNADFSEYGDYDFPVPEDFPDDSKFDVCVNGLLCCMGFYGILAFDLNNDVFTIGNPLPVRSSNYCLTNFNDSVAVITSKENEGNHVFNLWTLDDEACLRGSGVEASWTLKLSIDVQDPDPCVWGCFNSGDFLLCTDDDVRLLYNSHNKEARIAPFFIPIGRRVIKYNESLVSITGSHQVDWNAHEDES